MQDVLAIRSLRSPDRLLLSVLLLALAVLAVFPFYWMVIGSIMTPAELFASVPRLWPSDPDVNAYRRIFSLVPLGRYFLNSLVVSVTTTVIAVLISSMAGTVSPA
jgi:multiple sugar transport system permease protein